MATPQQFIVDNTAEDWKALQYVREWCDISSAIDIATGHFEIGAFLALDGAWQKVDKIRLLIGGETSRTTADAIAAALDTSIDVERQIGDAFLTGVDAVVDGIRSGKIEIRVYKPKKFHAKAYITHSKLKVVGSAALVGSSNFTRPGLTQNVELNVKFQGPEVADLQEWYENHWDEATPVNPELLAVLEHNVRAFTPFEVYAKALHALTANVDPTDKTWEESDSVIYPLLAPYQQEGFHSLIEMSRRWNGGFLTDGVGLGKTFVGLMLTEYYAVRHRKNVLIMATKTGKDAVWDPELRDRLPELFGQFSNVLVRAHTDLTTQKGADEIEHLAKRADVVIIDEAHNFRNHGKAPTGRRGQPVGLPLVAHAGDLQGQDRLPAHGHADQQLPLRPRPPGRAVHRRRRGRPLRQHRHQQPAKYMVELEKPFKAAVPDSAARSPTLMAKDKLFQSIIHQNSRKYAVESAKVAGGAEVVFPETQVPRVVRVRLRNALLPSVHRAAERLQPRHAAVRAADVLPAGVLERQGHRHQRREPAEAGRRPHPHDLPQALRVEPRRLRGLVPRPVGQGPRAGSTSTRKIDPDQEPRLADWRAANEPTLKAIHDRYRATLEEVWHEEDLTEEELNELEYNLVGGDYKLHEMIDAAFEDLDQLAAVHGSDPWPGRDTTTSTSGSAISCWARLTREEAAEAGEGTLDKTVFTPEFRTEPVIVFTEFADTARYLEEQLSKDGLAEVDRIDGTRGNDRYAMIKRFAPFYNKVSADDRTKLAPLRVLVSTDVLSEGVNLQDGTLLVNYDIHWNPVRLMQRIGRVDRRMNPAIEAELVKEKPSAKKSRGHIQIRNFLPPADIETLLTLYSRVQSKTLDDLQHAGHPGRQAHRRVRHVRRREGVPGVQGRVQRRHRPHRGAAAQVAALVKENPGLDDSSSASPTASPPPRPASRRASSSAAASRS